MSQIPHQSKTTPKRQSPLKRDTLSLSTGTEKDKTKNRLSGVGNVRRSRSKRWRQMHDIGTGRARSMSESVPETVDWYNAIQGAVGAPKADDSAKPNFVQRISRSALNYTTAEHPWVYLFSLGVIVAMSTGFINLILEQLIKVREMLLSPLAHISSLTVGQIIGSLGWSLGFALIAFTFVRYLSKEAAGSGIPAMKVILSNVIMDNFLSLRCLIAKSFGLLCALAANLSIGKEGPFVHIASIFGNLLIHLKPFRRMAFSDALRSQLLSAGCAVGVAVTFGAPVGGVLFSMEVTNMFYLVKNLWHGLFAASVASLTTMLFLQITNWATQTQTQTHSGADMADSHSAFALTVPNMSDAAWDAWELLLFVLLGVLCGFVSYFFIRVIVWIKSFLDGIKNKFLSNKLLHVVLTVLITWIISVLFTPFRVGQEHALETMLTTKASVFGVYSAESYLWVLPIFFGVKLLLTALTIGLPIPCGLFMPVILLGAVFGRMYGELCVLIWPTVDPSGYALVGAAAFASAVTRTMSTAVVIFEATGQLHHMIPVILGILAANAVNGMWSVSIYEVLLRMNKLPHIPTPSLFAREPRQSARGYTAQDIMRRNIFVITPTLTYGDILELLLVTKKHHYAFPVVDSREGMHILGVVQRHSLQQLLDTAQTSMERRAGEKATQKMAGGAMSFVHRLSVASQGSQSGAAPSTPSPLSFGSTGQKDKEKEKEKHKRSDERGLISSSDVDVDVDSPTGDGDKHTLTLTDDSLAAEAHISTLLGGSGEAKDDGELTGGDTIGAITQEKRADVRNLFGSGEGEGDEKAKEKDKGKEKEKKEPEEEEEYDDYDYDPVPINRMGHRSTTIRSEEDLKEKLQSLMHGRPDQDESSQNTLVALDGLRRQGLDPSLFYADFRTAEERHRSEVTQPVIDEAADAGIDVIVDIPTSTTHKGEGEGEGEGEKEREEKGEGEGEVGSSEGSEGSEGSSGSDMAIPEVVIHRPSIARPRRVTSSEKEKEKEEEEGKKVKVMEESPEHRTDSESPIEYRQPIRGVAHETSAISVHVPARSKTIIRPSHPMHGRPNTRRGSWSGDHNNYLSNVIPVDFGPTAMLPPGVKRSSGWPAVPPDTLKADYNLKSDAEIHDLTPEQLGILRIDPAPFIVSGSMTLERIYFLFTMLQLSHTYVVAPGGVLVGVVGKRDVVRHHRDAIDRTRDIPMRIITQGMGIDVNPGTVNTDDVVQRSGGRGGVDEITIRARGRKRPWLGSPNYD